MRSSYHQHPGNPVQRQLLPKWQMPFEFPFAGDTRTGMLTARNQLLWLLCVIDITHSFLAFPIGRQFGRGFPLLLVPLVILLGSGTKRTDSSILLKCLAALIISALVIALSEYSMGISCSLLAAGLSYYLLQFGNHWIGRCTVSPLPIEAARQIRRDGGLELKVYALIPFLAMAVTVRADHLIVFPLTLLVAAISNLLLTGAPLRAWRAGLVALNSWCGYNSEQHSAPGIWQSPIGSINTRLTMLALLAGSFGILWGLAQPHRWQGFLNLGGFLFFPAVVFAISPLGLLAPLSLRMLRIRQQVAAEPAWQKTVLSCRQSTNPVLRDSYFQGHVAADGSPVIVHRETFNQHAHFLGPSGGGKTSKGLCPWIEQTIAFGDCSVIVLDLKADSLELLASLEAGQHELQKQTGQQLPLKVFSSMSDRPTHTFNPFHAAFWNRLERSQQTDIICSALGLNYGTDYGASFYSSTNAAIVSEALRLNPGIGSFRELSDRCSELIRPQVKSQLHAEIKKAGVHVCEELKRMAEFEQLQQVSNTEGEQIELASMFTQPQLLYLHLSSTVGASSAPGIARLFTYFLLAAAAQTERKNRVYLVIDEFQRMAAKSLDYLLQLARSMDIGVVLSNQSMEDLKTLKSNLIPAIEANCQYRQWFDVGAVEDLERIERVAGQSVEWLSSVSHSVSSKDSSVTHGSAEHLLPRLSTNEINIAGSSRDLSIVRIGRDEGYAQYGRFPFVVRTDFHISKTEYQQRRQFAWPKLQPGMIIPQDSRLTPPVTPTGPVIVSEIDGIKDSSQPKNSDTLEDLFDSFEEPERLKRKRRKKSNPSNEETDGE